MDNFENKQEEIKAIQPSRKIFGKIFTIIAYIVVFALGYEMATISYTKEFGNVSGTTISKMNKIEKMLRSVPRENLVRICLIGERVLGRTFDTEAILSSFKSAYYYVEIKDESRVKICADDFKNDISLKGEFIRSVLADETLSDSEKESVINLGLSVLMDA